MVVVGPLLVDFMPGTGQAQKPVLIGSAIAELAVEALDEGILCRLAQLDEGQRDFPLTRPQEHRLFSQLAPQPHLEPVVRWAPGGQHRQPLLGLVPLLAQRPDLLWCQPVDGGQPFAPVVVTHDRSSTSPLFFT